MRLGHAAIKTKNLDDSLEFYTGNFNLLVKEKKYIEAHKTTLVFLKDAFGDFELELISEDKQKEADDINDFFERNKYELENKVNPEDCSFAHFAFLTDNIDRDVEAMKAKGVIFKREPFYSLDKSMKLAFLEDPDKIMIELIQYFK